MYVQDHLIMVVTYLGGGVINPKALAPPARPPAWSLSGPATCDRPSSLPPPGLAPGSGSVGLRKDRAGQAVQRFWSLAAQVADPVARNRGGARRWRRWWRRRWGHRGDGGLADQVVAPVGAHHDGGVRGLGQDQARDPAVVSPGDGERARGGERGHRDHRCVSAVRADGD